MFGIIQNFINIGLRYYVMVGYFSGIMYCSRLLLQLYCSIISCIAI